MPKDKEPILGLLDEPVFPLTDRQTPLLDKVRNRRNGKDTGKEIGILSGKMAVLANEDERKETANEMMVQFREGLAESLGVPEEKVSQEAIVQFGSLFIEVDEEDLVVDSEDDKEDSDGNDEGGESEEESESKFSS